MLCPVVDFAKLSQHGLDSCWVSVWPDICDNYCMGKLAIIQAPVEGCVTSLYWDTGQVLDVPHAVEVDSHMVILLPKAEGFYISLLDCCYDSCQAVWVYTCCADAQSGWRYQLGLQVSFFHLFCKEHGGQCLGW